MKIAVVYQHYFPEQFRITPLCEELVKRGHEVSVYTGLPNYPHGNIPRKYRYFKNRKEIINGVHVFRSFEIGRKPSKIGLAINYVSYTISSCIKALFIKKNFDVIFAYSTSPILMSIPALILKKRSGKKIHMYVMDIWPACLSAMNVKSTSLLYRIMKRISKWIYKSCDTISYSSKKFKEYMRDTHGISLSDDKYLAQFSEPFYEREAEYKDDDECVFTFAGNIGKMQSVETILEAAYILKNENIEINIIGDGSNLQKCKEMARELNLNNIIFHGSKPASEMPFYYEKSSAMLLTMKDDELVNQTLPAKVQSYMASAKPIIGAINGESADLIKEAGCGIVSKAEDAEALADNIMKFKSLSNDEKYALSKNSIKYYKENFLFENHINKIEEFLQELL